MPLFRCPDCGRLVSTAAAACPHCGWQARPARGARPAAPTLDQLGEPNWPTAPDDLLDRPLLLDLHGALRRLTLASAPRGGGRNVLRAGDDFLVCWDAATLVLLTTPARGEFVLRSARGKVYLLTPAGHVEFVLYQV
jgi:hypothetical protein